eukprot:CAMPEP_0168577878 /NCGR_PEP_ID=MMETSP0413-20121227/21022_1 /TAXON_ID=136452 /ORGANISM="Filamoeba nolandi, Strain NC-AS-23-1" /LENGTH=116 /DNA_ID=CAMNT_0008611663 /DNA_START=123 /DNA_END=470 /DNA_ORIENTATION=-
MSLADVAVDSIAPHLKSFLNEVAVGIRDYSGNKGVLSQFLAGLAIQLDTNFDNPDVEPVLESFHTILEKTSSSEEIMDLLDCAPSLILRVGNWANERKQKMMQLCAEKLAQVETEP